MNVVDSSGWLEYFADGPNADFFEEALRDSDALCVPAITVYEVFKVVLRQRGEDKALRVVAHMHRGRLVDLDADLSMSAARLSLHLGLPMADSIILATARAHHATLWTQDADFEGLEDVRYTPAGGNR